MTAAGLIFANIHDQSIPELTRVRSMASVPFGCRYRLIDFTLSNLVNSGINRIGLITHHNYQSLLDHIGTGKDWDLARRSGGIKLIPPYITEGCEIYGTVKNSVVGPGVKIMAGAHVEDCVLMGDCVIEADATVQYAIIDSDVVIGAGATVGAPRATGAEIAVVGENITIAAGATVEPGAMLSE